MHGYFSMQKKSARFMFYPPLCVFVYTCLGKDYAMALLDWMTSQEDH